MKHEVPRLPKMTATLLGLLLEPVMILGQEVTGDFFLADSRSWP